MDGCHKRAFLVAGWASAALLARIGDKHFMFAVCTTNAGKSFLQIAALEEGCHGLFDDTAPIAVLGLKPFIVDLLERIKMLVDQTPQVGGLRVAWSIQGRRLVAQRSHEKNALSNPTVANRTAPSQLIDPLHGGLTEGANEKVYMGHVYGRTRTAGRRPPLIDSWS